MSILKRETSFHKKLVADCLKSNHTPKVIILHQLRGAEFTFFFLFGTQPAVQADAETEQEEALTCTTSWSHKANVGIIMDH